MTLNFGQTYMETKVALKTVTVVQKQPKKTSCVAWFCGVYTCIKVVNTLILDA